MNAGREDVREVHTPRLLLRLPRMDDALPLSRMMNAGISARLASWPAELSQSAAGSRLAAARADAELGLAMPMVIERRATAGVIGWIGATPVEGEPSCMLLTYWLGAQHQGQGLMREAAPAALAAVFRRLTITEVRAAVQTDNPISRSVLRSLGMRLLGLGRIWCAARGRDETCEWWGVHRPVMPAEVMQPAGGAVLTLQAAAAPSAPS